MKKSLLFILFSLLTISVFSQKIEKNIIDDFTGEQVIYTSWEKIKGGNGMTGKDNLVFRFRYENETIYMHIKWVTKDIIAIHDEDKLIFKMSDGQNVTVNTIASYISSKGAGATGLSMSGIEGIDPIYVGDCSAFATKAFASKVRIHTTDGYIDLDLKEKDSMKLNTSYQLLIDQINK